MGYTNSSLVTYKNLTSDRTAPRKNKIDTITIHCYVGQVTAKRGCDYFATSDRKVSSNYVVGYDGSIGLSVEEQNRAWTSGGKDEDGNQILVNGISGADNDHRAVTIEVASDTKPPYAITSKAMKALIELVADICKRNDIKKLLWKGDKSLVGQVDKQNMTVHRWFANTSCPGDYLYEKHSYIANEVNKKIGAVTDDTLKFKVGDIVNFAGGKHYSSANASTGRSVSASKAKITAKSESGMHPYHLRAVNDKGSYISGVYGWVDENTVSAIKVETTTKPSTSEKIDAGTKLDLKSIPLYASSSTTTKSGTKTGTYYVWSEDVVRDRIRITNKSTNVGKSGQVIGWIDYADALNSVCSTTISQTPSKTLDDWAKEVINGKHGNGSTNRRTSLKKNGCPYTYEEVQTRVNIIYNKK